MDVGVSMGLKNENGSLKLFVMECGCYMKDLDITLNGGSSWFYQGYVVHSSIFFNTLSTPLSMVFLYKTLVMTCI